MKKLKDVLSGKYFVYKNNVFYKNFTDEYINIFTKRVNKLDENKIIDKIYKETEILKKLRTMKVQNLKGDLY